MLSLLNDGPTFHKEQRKTLIQREYETRVLVTGHCDSKRLRLERLGCCQEVNGSADERIAAQVWGPSC